MRALSRAVFRWANLALYAAIIAEMLRLWIAPGPGDAGRIYTLTILMAFEFVMAHSGLFMAIVPRRFALFAFVPFYGLFALAFSAAAGSLLILGLYLAVVALRMRHAFSDPPPEVRARGFATSFAALMIYFGCVVVFAMAADFVPVFGLTPDYLQRAGYFQLMTAEGVFPEMPQVPLAMGAVYYALLGYAEFRIARTDMAGDSQIARAARNLPKRFRDSRP